MARARPANSAMVEGWRLTGGSRWGMASGSPATEMSVARYTVVLEGCAGAPRRVRRSVRRVRRAGGAVSGGEDGSAATTTAVTQTAAEGTTVDRHGAAGLTGVSPGGRVGLGRHGLKDSRSRGFCQLGASFVEDISPDPVVRSGERFVLPMVRIRPAASV